MKYSNTTIKELSARYRAVLKKCAIFNAMVVVGVALLSAPAMAGTGLEGSDLIAGDGSADLFEARGDVIVSGFSGYNVPTDDSSVIYVPKGDNSLTVAANSEIKDNTSYHGAIAVSSSAKSLTIKEGVSFKDNTTYYQGAAIASYKKLDIKGTEAKRVLFEGNKVGILPKDADEPTDGVDGGGAIYLGQYSQATIRYTDFIGNDSTYVGGAIAARFNKTDVPEGALIEHSTFQGNKAKGSGGAISNIYDGVFNISDSKFIGNETQTRGGAINNGVEINYGGETGVDSTNHGTFNLTNVTFSGNIAKTVGGAIFNDDGGTLNFAGDNVFTGNMANSKANDIYSDGEINVAGSLTLDGGIAGTGSVVFKDGASLTATLNTTKIEAASVEFEGNNKINLIVENGTADGEYGFITTTTLEGLEGEEDVTFDSSLYNLSLTEAGKIALEAKSAGQIAQDTGVSEETAQTLAGIAAVDAPVAAAISEAAQEVLASGDAATVEAELGKLTPNDKNATQQAAIDVATQVAGTVSGRLSSLGASVGRSGGDVKAEYGMWAQGMYNKSKLDGAFRGYTQGLAFGVDTLINDVYTVGIGYAYTATDVKSDRKTKAFGDNFFVYGQYKPSNWYVNGMVSYAHTNYKEEASVFGNAVDAKYDVDTYAGQLAAGYETKIGITPEIGARYIYLKQDTYSNGISTIDADNYDVLTGIAAVKYAAPAMGEEVVVTPEARMAATYDFIADNGQSVVSMPGASAYVAEGERLARFGAEFGVSAKVEYKDLELSLGYDFGVRRDYTSQTGSIKLKYNF